MLDGLVLQALGPGRLAAVAQPDVAHTALVLPLVVAGTGIGMVFAATASAATAAVSARSGLRGRSGLRPWPDLFGNPFQGIAGPEPLRVLVGYHRTRGGDGLETISKNSRMFRRREPGVRGAR